MFPKKIDNRVSVKTTKKFNFFPDFENLIVAGIESVVFDSGAVSELVISDSAQLCNVRVIALRLHCITGFETVRGLLDHCLITGLT